MVRADADATRGDGESSRARELREALARGEFVTVRAGTYDGWVTAKRRRKMKKTVGEDDGDDFGRAREGAKTSLEGSDVFAVASASVETWGREETERKKNKEKKRLLLLLLSLFQSLCKSPKNSWKKKTSRLGKR